MQNLRVGSVLNDGNGGKLTVVGFSGIFTIAKYDLNSKGEIWLVPSHLDLYTLEKY